MKNILFRILGGLIGIFCITSVIYILVCSGDYVNTKKQINVVVGILLGIYFLRFAFREKTENPILKVSTKNEVNAKELDTPPLQKRSG